MAFTFSKCRQCGKIPFFSSLLPSGICQKCDNKNYQEAKQQRLAAEERAKKDAAQESYHRAMSLYKQSQVSLENSSLADVQACKDACSEFVTLLPKVAESSYASDLFARDTTFFAGSTLAEHSVFGSCWLTWQGNNRVLDLTRLIDDVARKGDEAKEFFEQTSKFEALRDNLTFAPVTINSAAEQLPQRSSNIVEIMGFKGKPLTVRTTLDRVCNFIAIDVETTGLSPESAEIVELCAIKYIDFQPTECFQTYVKPRHGIRYRAEQINHIHEETVANAPYIEQVMEAFDAFVDGAYPLVGHNIPFDIKFLYASNSRIADLAMRKKRPCYDTLALAKREYKWFAGFKLDYLCRNLLHIARTDAHSAVSDSLVAGILFETLCRDICD